MKLNWLPYFRQEIEKIAFAGAIAGVGGKLLGAGMNTMMVAGTAGDIKQSQGTNQLQSLKSNEQNMQLPGSNAFQFEGSKRINPSVNSATQMY
jgi:hypothetical protein